MPSNAVRAMVIPLAGVMIYSFFLMLDHATRTEGGFNDREVFCGAFKEYFHDSEKNRLPKGLSTWRLAIHEEKAEEIKVFALGFPYQGSISHESFVGAEDACVEKSKTMLGLRRGFVSQVVVNDVRLISEGAARQKYFEGIMIFDLSLFLCSAILIAGLWFRGKK